MIQLNKILKTFKKTIDQLEQLTATNNIEVSRNTEQIDRLQEKEPAADRRSPGCQGDRRESESPGRPGPLTFFANPRKTLTTSEHP
ncbi:hypothetical protein ACPA1H_25045 [Ectopseudomonas chengduensis]